MDRFCIIQQQVLNKTEGDEINRCGEHQCECVENRLNEARLSQKSPLLHKVLLAITLCAGATMLVIAAKESIGNTLNKRNGIISCGPGIDYSGRLPDKNVPGDGGTGKICPHQQ